jgi:hypothetical protein
MLAVPTTAIATATTTSARRDPTAKTTTPAATAGITARR